jgi:hypothetical protein
MNHAAVISPNDNADLPGGGTIYLSFVNTGGAQTLQISTISGEIVSIVLPSGMYPIRAKRVWQSGTSCTAIVGYWI